jgi:hypothetical protein
LALAGQNFGAVKQDRANMDPDRPPSTRNAKNLNLFSKKRQLKHAANEEYVRKLKKVNTDNLAIILGTKRNLYDLAMEQHQTKQERIKANEVYAGL